MSAGNWVAVLGMVLALVTTVSGWVVGHLLSQSRAKDDVITAQRDLINDLRSQRDMLKVTAEIQDRFFSVVPKLPQSDKGTP